MLNSSLHDVLKQMTSYQKRTTILGHFSVFHKFSENQNFLKHVVSKSQSTISIFILDQFKPNLWIHFYKKSPKLYFP